MRPWIVLLGLAVACEGAHRDHGAGPDGGLPPGTPGSDTGPYAPANANMFGGFGSDDLSVSPPDGTFDTDHDCTPVSALGACTPLPIACVCRASMISIGSLHVTGSRALVVLASREITVATLLDVSAHGVAAGPGAIVGYTGSASGDYVNAAGGSFGTAGAADPRGSDTIAATYGDPSLVPLVGGMIGQDGGGDNGLNRNGSGGSGGGGGGALQLSAGVQLTIDGAIEADGGGGNGGISSGEQCGGGGGGAGGGVLLEGASVVIDGRVRANGGGGGGGGGEGGYGGPGYDGEGSDMFTTSHGGGGAPSMGCPLEGYIGGGYGGDGATGSGSATYGGYGGSVVGCIGGPDWGCAGGGGGGLGRIAVNTATGCDCSGTFSPAPGFGTVVVR